MLFGHWQSNRTNGAAWYHSRFHLARCMQCTRNAIITFFTTFDPAQCDNVMFLHRTPDPSACGSSASVYYTERRAKRGRPGKEAIYTPCRHHGLQVTHVNIQQYIVMRYVLNYITNRKTCLECRIFIKSNSQDFSKCRYNALEHQSFYNNFVNDEHSHRNYLILYREKNLKAFICEWVAC